MFCKELHDNNTKINSGDTTIFFIRNYFCVISSEAIILQYSISNPIAYIVNRDGNYELVQNIRKMLNPSIWGSIKIVDVSLRCKNTFSKKSMQNLANLKKVLLTTIRIDNPNSLYITVANDNIEKFVYYYAKRNHININKYEEGGNHYADPIKLENPSLIKQIIRFIKYPRHHYVLLSEYKCKYNKVYSFFPSNYKKKDYSEHLCILFNVQDNKQYDNNNHKILILTGPYSESGIMLEEEEFLCYNEILKKLPRDCEKIVKPHPRENIEKIHRFCKTFDCKIISESYLNLPAEIIIKDSFFSYIIGIWSSALLYATKISKDSKVISYVGTLQQKYIELADVVKMFSKEGIDCI